MDDVKAVIAVDGKEKTIDVSVPSHWNDCDKEATDAYMEKMATRAGGTLVSYPLPSEEKKSQESETPEEETPTADSDNSSETSSDSETTDDEDADEAETETGDVTNPEGGSDDSKGEESS